MEGRKITVYCDSHLICMQQNWQVLAKFPEKILFECCYWSFHQNVSQYFIRWFKENEDMKFRLWGA